MEPYDDTRAMMANPPVNGAKVFRGGQAIGPAIRTSEATATQDAELPSLTGIMYGRRIYHFDRVSTALEGLSVALDAAADDGFDIRYHCNGPRDTNQTLGADSPPARFPRSYDAELEITFSHPF